MHRCCLAERLYEYTFYSSLREVDFFLSRQFATQRCQRGPCAPTPAPRNDARSATSQIPSHQSSHSSLALELYLLSDLPLPRPRHPRGRPSRGGWDQGSGPVVPPPARAAPPLPRRTATTEPAEPTDREPKPLTEPDRSAQWSFSEERGLRCRTGDPAANQQQPPAPLPNHPGLQARTRPMRCGCGADDPPHPHPLRNYYTHAAPGHNHAPHAKILLYRKRDRKSLLRVSMSSKYY